jgi:RNA-dependent RNA polymerase
LRRTRRIPPHCVYVDRCVITPLRVIVEPPQLETSNSILRAYSSFNDRFLRVNFATDDGPLDINEALRLVDVDSNGEEGMIACIRRVLSHGVVIAGRLFCFLTFSESQIKCHFFDRDRKHSDDTRRELGCWMIAEDASAGFTRKRILRSMGGLSEERIIAKHAARQGLVSKQVFGLRGDAHS